MKIMHAMQNTPKCMYKTFTNFSSFIIQKQIFSILKIKKLCRDTSICMATGYGLDGQVLFLAWARYFSSIQTCSWDHPACYPFCIRAFFPGDKAAGA
jgi:hypothetical protein